jgi:hypothetical protein
MDDHATYQQCARPATSAPGGGSRQPAGLRDRRALLPEVRRPAAVALHRARRLLCAPLPARRERTVATGRGPATTWSRGHDFSLSAPRRAAREAQSAQCEPGLGDRVGGGLRQSPAQGPATRCRRWARCRTRLLMSPTPQGARCQALRPGTSSVPAAVEVIRAPGRRPRARGPRRPLGAGRTPRAPLVEASSAMTARRHCRHSTTAEWNPRQLGAPGRGDCGQAGCEELLFDPANCGACGRKRGEQEVCVQGGCVGGDGACPAPCGDGDRICCGGGSD